MSPEEPNDVLKRMEQQLRVYLRQQSVVIRREQEANARFMRYLRRAWLEEDGSWRGDSE